MRNAGFTQYQCCGEESAVVDQGSEHEEGGGHM